MGMIIKKHTFILNYAKTYEYQNGDLIVGREDYIFELKHLKLLRDELNKIIENKTFYGNNRGEITIKKKVYKRDNNV